MVGSRGEVRDGLQVVWRKERGEGVEVEGVDRGVGVRGRNEGEVGQRRDGGGKRGGGRMEKNEGR